MRGSILSLLEPKSIGGYRPAVMLALLALLAVAAPTPLSPQEAGQRVEVLWKRRDDPAALAEAKQILDEGLGRAPEDYGLLWRSAAWHFWKGDDPALPAAERARHGKLGWDLAERAVARNPDHAAGHVWAALNLGNYSLGLGIVRALAQGIEGKFRHHLEAAERLDRRYGHGSIQNAWGAFYLTLPWPKRDVKKSEAYLRQALEINPHNLRTRVFMAQLNLREDRPAEARRLLQEVLGAVPGQYDPPEERRAKLLAAETLRKVVDATK
jgi:tetratricopeptide (TPR) repeat protein